MSPSDILCKLRSRGHWLLLLLALVMSGIGFGFPAVANAATGGAYLIDVEQTASGICLNGDSIVVGVFTLGGVGKDLSNISVTVSVPGASQTLTTQDRPGGHIGTVPTSYGARLGYITSGTILSLVFREGDRIITPQDHPDLTVLHAKVVGNTCPGSVPPGTVPTTKPSPTTVPVPTTVPTTAPTTTVTTAPTTSTTQAPTTTVTGPTTTTTQPAPSTTSTTKPVTTTTRPPECSFKGYVLDLTSEWASIKVSGHGILVVNELGNGVTAAQAKADWGSSLPQHPVVYQHVDNCGQARLPLACGKSYQVDYVTMGPILNPIDMDHYYGKRVLDHGYIDGQPCPPVLGPAISIVRPPTQVVPPAPSQPTPSVQAGQCPDGTNPHPDGTCSLAVTGRNVAALLWVVLGLLAFGAALVWRSSRNSRPVMVN